MAGLSAGLHLIATERKRQVEVEGWTPEHDDEHTDGSLALAAVCYATPRLLYVMPAYARRLNLFDPWPASWASGWDKRMRYGARRDSPGEYPPDPKSYSEAEALDLLVKAGALIAAEIERRLRRKA